MPPARWRCFPGYLGGALGFREELARFDRRQLIRLTGLTLLGGLIGSLLLLVSSNEAFSLVVPFLLLGATLAFLFGDRIRSWAASHSRGVTPQGAAGLILVSIYGGYFNGGLGIVLLALFALWGMASIHEMNGLKNGLSFALSAISVAVFAIGGLVEWKTGGGDDGGGNPGRLCGGTDCPRPAEIPGARADCRCRLFHERGLLLAPHRVKPGA